MGSDIAITSAPATAGAPVTVRREAGRAKHRAVPPSGRWQRIGGLLSWGSATFVAAFAVMRTFGLERTWYLTTATAFTPYVACFSVLTAGASAAARRWPPAAIATGAAAAMIAGLVPMTTGSPDPGPGPRLHVMSSNMKIGAADAATIVALARRHKTDVLALDEYTPDAARRLATAGIDELLPYNAQTPLPGATGSAIFSRYPLRDIGYRRLAGGFGQEYATVLVPGARPLVVEAVHAAAPIAPSHETAWVQSIDREPAATVNGPVRLLLGDFNGTLDQRRMRTLLGTGYRDIASQVGDGLDTTWPYDGRLIPPIVLDHVFADQRIGAVHFGVALVPGTDHKAIYATLTLPEA